MRALAEQEKPAVIVMDCGAVPGLEFTALRMLVEAEEKWRERGVEIWLAALNPEVLELVRKTPLAERLGREPHVLHRRGRGDRVRGAPGAGQAS